MSVAVIAVLSGRGLGGFAEEVRVDGESVGHAELFHNDEADGINQAQATLAAGADDESLGSAFVVFGGVVDRKVMIAKPAASSVRACALQEEVNGFGDDVVGGEEPVSLANEVVVGVYGGLMGGVMAVDEGDNSRGIDEGDGRGFEMGIGHRWVLLPGVRRC